MKLSTEAKQAIIVFGGSVALFTLLMWAMKPKPKKFMSLTASQAANAIKALDSYRMAKDAGENAASLSELNEMIFDQYRVRVKEDKGSLIVINESNDEILTA